jgi:hypothetical protein
MQPPPRQRRPPHLHGPALARRAAGLVNLLSPPECQRQRGQQVGKRLRGAVAGAGGGAGAGGVRGARGGGKSRARTAAGPLSALLAANRRAAEARRLPAAWPGPRARPAVAPCRSRCSSGPRRCRRAAAPGLRPPAPATAARCPPRAGPPDRGAVRRGPGGRAWGASGRRACRRSAAASMRAVGGGGRRRRRRAAAHHEQVVDAEVPEAGRLVARRSHVVL